MSTWFNVIAILVCLLFLYSCSSDDSSSEEIVSLQDLISCKDLTVRQAGSVLSSYRYHKDIDIEEMEVLKAIWSGTSDENRIVFNDSRVRITVANLLVKFGDSSNAAVYLDYIRGMINSQKPHERAFAAQSLGSIGLDEDVDVLLKILLNDESFPATQAGFALVAIDSDKSEAALRKAMQSLKKSRDGNKEQTYKYIIEYMHALNRKL